MIDVAIVIKNTRYHVKGTVHAFVVSKYTRTGGEEPPVSTLFAPRAPLRKPSTTEPEWKAVPFVWPSGYGRTDLVDALDAIMLDAGNELPGDTWREAVEQYKALRDAVQQFREAVQRVTSLGVRVRAADAADAADAAVDNNVREKCLLGRFARSLAELH